MAIDKRVFLFSVVLGLLLLVADVVLDQSFFQQETVGIPLLKGMPLRELFMRLLVAVSFVGFGWVCARLLYLRQAAERKSVAISEFQQQLLDTIPVPIFFKNSDYVYLGCNKSFGDFLGMPVDEIIGKTVFDIAPRNLADIYHAADAALMDNPGVQIYESKVKKKDGQELNVIFHKATFRNPDGDLGGMIGVILDITPLRQAEEAKEKVIAELTEALTQVKLLSGFLPICSACKKIRNDTGYWQQIETYIREHSEAEFSHSICPDCSRKLYDDYAEEMRTQNEEEKI